jgi:hypothetical protein
VTAFFHSGVLTVAFQLMSYQFPPKVCTTVVSGANRSPQPGLPRMQMPAMSAVLTFLAASATCCQVGLFGIVTPALSRTSLLYMRIEDSP